MKRKIFVVATAVAALSTQAQNGINSPYSRYGLGIQSERAMGFNKGMGGVAQGFRNGKQINPANPASYSAVDSLSAIFDLGLSLQNGNYKMDDLQKNVRNTSFDYVAFQFKAAKNCGVTLGLLPLTNIKYSFASTSETLSGTENITSSYSFSGDGGTREVFLGTGWQPVKNISIGFNAGYVWGDYNHNMTMSFSESSVFSMARIYSAEIRTYDLQAGFQFNKAIGKDDKIVFGATYTLGHNVDNRAYRTTETINSTSVETQHTDTIHNAFQLPHSIAAGLTYYHKNKWRLGADFELQKWFDCRFPNQQTSLNNNGEAIGAYTSSKGQLNDRMKFSAGFDWTPAADNASHYFSRCTYKAGAYYSQSYAKADASGKISDKPYEFGVSAGVTLPVANKHIWYNAPLINLSVQWVQTNIPYLNTNTLKQCALKENYLRFCIGLTFNERWFYKSKLQ